MKRIVLALVALAATSAAVSAAPWDRYGWRDRYYDRGYVVEQPGIQPGTIAAIIALQLAQQAAKEKETVVIERDSTRERVVPLK